MLTQISLVFEKVEALPWHAAYSMIYLLIVHIKIPQCLFVASTRKNVSIPYGTRGSFISCLVSFRNRISCFCTNGINLWNVLFVGTAQLVNPLECIEERSRAVYYLQRCLIYSLMNYSLNSLHVMQVFALVMTNSTLLHTQMMSTYSVLCARPAAINWHMLPIWNGVSC